MHDLTGFFAPQGVAVAGASQNADKIGHAILQNIISSGYTGAVYPINPRAEQILGLTCYPDLDAVNAPMDLVVVAVPAAKTIDIALQCARLNIKNMVVITAGFKEVGPQGLQLETKLVQICQKHNINMLGPNCVGIINTHAPLNASFSAAYPRQAGDITFISQSGAMLVAILDWSIQTGLSFSKVVSLGNKAQLSEAHFIAAAAQDPTTKVILCYIEDVADGEHFLQVARQAAQSKPLIILKSGTSGAGARAASSHTGALAGSDVAYDTAFRQCGVIRAHSMTELFDLALAFTTQPVPARRQVALITNAGGPGIVATDAVENKALAMAEFSKTTLENLRQKLPAASNIYNPVDILGDARADRYQVALEHVLADKNVGSAVVLVCPTAVTDAVPIAQVIVDTQKKHRDKPVLAAFMGGPMLAAGAKLLTDWGIPCFTFPESAVGALGGMQRYKDFKHRPPAQDTLRQHATDKKPVQNIFNMVREDNRLALLGHEAYQVAHHYGIDAAPVQLATTPGQAVELAEAMGYPVVLKVASPKIMHKTDVGGVKINLQDAAAVKQAYGEINNNVHHYLPQINIYGIEVQKMMPKGIELIMGMSRDIQFGPLMAFGLGGIYVNLLQDVSFRLARGLNTGEIQRMMTETKAYTLMRGYRGEMPVDMTALVNMMARAASLVLDFPTIMEMDINPVFAYPQGASALDVKITIS